MLPGLSRSPSTPWSRAMSRSEEHTSELQSLTNIVCRLLLEKKRKEIILVRGIVQQLLRLTREQQESALRPGNPAAARRSPGGGRWSCRSSSPPRLVQGTPEP